MKISMIANMKPVCLSLAKTPRVKGLGPSSVPLISLPLHSCLLKDVVRLVTLGELMNQPHGRAATTSCPIDDVPLAEFVL